MKTTLIDGRHYDLSQFDHPGGLFPLSCAFGRDATEMFYTYHQFKNMFKIRQQLKKFEVSQGQISQSKNFDWRKTLSSEFYEELCSITKPYFERNGTKINAQKIIEVTMLFIATTISYIYLLRGSWLSLFLFPSLLFIFTSNVAHDASHFAVSESPWINCILSELIVFVAPKYYWMYQHVIGHHCYTSIPGVDPDISIRVYRHHPDVPFLPVHRYQSLFPWILPIIRFPPFYILSIIRCFQDSLFIGGHVMIDTPHLNRRGMILPTLILLASLFAPLLSIGWNGKGIIFSLLPYVFFNYYFMTVAGVGHGVEGVDRSRSDNFFIHQVPPLSPSPPAEKKNRLK
jgi:fatty acid desaturase